jgi:hypothetical protein
MTEFWNQKWFRDALPYAAGALALTGALAGIGASRGWFGGGSSGGMNLSGIGEAASAAPRAASGIAQAGSGWTNELARTGATAANALSKGAQSSGIFSDIPMVGGVADFIGRNPGLILGGGLLAAGALSGSGGQTKPQTPEEVQRQVEEQRRRELERWNAIRTEPLRPLSYAGPSSGERRYFATGGGIREGGALRGVGDGMSDDIPAIAMAADGDHRPVAVADGEYVVAADVVSGLGNGSTEAGFRALDDMQARVRGARTGGRQPGAINAADMLPA